MGPLLVHHRADAEAGDPLYFGDIDHRHAAAFRRGQHHHAGRSVGLDAHPVALHLQPDLQVHAELRLRLDSFLRYRGAGRHPELSAVHGRQGSSNMSASEQTANLGATLATRRLSPSFDVLGVLRRGIVYMLLTVAAFVSVFPFLWMIVSSTNTAADVLKGKATFGDALWTNIVNFFTQ